LNYLPLSADFYDTFAAFAEATDIYNEYVGELKGIADKTGTDWKKLFFA